MNLLIECQPECGGRCLRCHAREHIPVRNRDAVHAPFTESAHLAEKQAYLLGFFLIASALSRLKPGFESRWGRQLFLTNSHKVALKGWRRRAKSGLRCSRYVHVEGHQSAMPYDSPSFSRGVILPPPRLMRGVNVPPPRFEQGAPQPERASGGSPAVPRGGHHRSPRERRGVARWRRARIGGRVGPPGSEPDFAGDDSPAAEPDRIDI